MVSPDARGVWSHPKRERRIREIRGDEVQVRKTLEEEEEELPAGPADEEDDEEGTEAAAPETEDGEEGEASLEEILTKKPEERPAPEQIGERLKNPVAVVAVGS